MDSPVTCLPFIPDHENMSGGDPCHNFSLGFMQLGATEFNDDDDAGETEAFTTWQTIILGLAGGCFSLITIGGNLIVIISFFLERTIRQPANYFIASLAVSDLLIGTVSMPLYTTYILSSKHWSMGETFCDLWLSVDYTACLCSIYTVFCITVDRFCSIKLPAKYRVWRTERKVLVMVFMTWAIPISVFFTTIFGWQYFVGKRTVPSNKCFVQYMEEPLFNCILQVGYFWITLTAMISLYSGIYKVALDLHQRSEAKRKKQASSLASMAERTVGHFGAVIGMTRNRDMDKTIMNATVENPWMTSGSGKLTDPDDVYKHEGGGLFSILTGAVDQDMDSNSSSSSPEHRSSTVKTSTPKSAISSSGGGKRKVRIKKYKSLSSSRQSSLNISITRNYLHPPSQTTNHRSGHVNRGLTLSVTSAESTSNKQLSVPLVARDKNCNARYRNYAKPEVTETEQLMCDDDRTNSEIAPTRANTNGRVSNEPEVNVSHHVTINVEHVIQQDAEVDDDHVMNAGMRMDDFDYPFNTTNCVTFGTVADYKAAECFQETEMLSHEHNYKVPVYYATWPKAGRVKRSKKVSFDEERRKSRKQPSNVKDEEIPIGVIDRSKASLEKLAEVRECLNLSQLPILNLDPASCENLATKIDSTSGLGKPNPADCSVSLNVPTLGQMQHLKIRSNSGGGQSPERQGSHKRKPLLKSGLLSRQPSAKVPSAGGDDGSKTPTGPMPQISTVAFWNFITGRYRGGKPEISEAERKLRRQQKKNENRARKALRTITIILGAFVLCWTPWHVMSMIMGFCGKDPFDCVSPILYDISYWLCYLNSPINPFCYAFVNQQFKQTFIRIIRLDWHRS